MAAIRVESVHNFIVYCLHKKEKDQTNFTDMKSTLSTFQVFDTWEALNEVTIQMTRIYCQGGIQKLNPGTD